MKNKILSCMGILSLLFISCNSNERQGAHSNLRVTESTEIVASKPVENGIIKKVDTANQEFKTLPKSHSNTAVDRNENDSLFRLDIIESENYVRIKAPKNIDFSKPDKYAKTEPTKFDDFNADNKRDVLVYLGACGTGGCIYGLFLKQHENYYKLVFMDYLKSPTFEKEENGFLAITSFEEIEPYNPSKLNVSIFRFDNYQYQLDTTFVESYE